MHFLKWLILGLYFVGSSIFSIESLKVDISVFVALALNGLNVICFFKLHQRFSETGKFLPLYILIGWAVSRVVYVSWGIQFDKYNIVHDESFLYSVTFVLLGWCLFELLRKKHQSKLSG